MLKFYKCYNGKVKGWYSRWTPGSCGESRVWQTIVDVVQNFLWRNKSQHYKAVVHNLLVNFKTIRAKMSIKLLYLCNHLDKFPENLGSCSNMQRVVFYRESKTSRRLRRGTKKDSDVSGLLLVPGARSAGSRSPAECMKTQVRFLTVSTLHQTLNLS